MAVKLGKFAVCVVESEIEVHQSRDHRSLSQHFKAYSNHRLRRPGDSRAVNPILQALYAGKRCGARSAPVASATDGEPRSGGQCPLPDSRLREDGKPGGAEAGERRAVGRRRSRPGAHKPRTRRIWGAKPPIPAPSGGQGRFGQSPSEASAGPLRRGGKQKALARPKEGDRPNRTVGKGWSRRREGGRVKGGRAPARRRIARQRGLSAAQQGEHEASGGTPVALRISVRGGAKDPATGTAKPGPH